MVVLLAIPLILLRLFGFLFFAGTTPLWAVVPALVLVALLIALTQKTIHRGITTFLVAAYGCSWWVHGAADMKLRLAEGQGGWLWFDVAEALLVLFLAVRLWMTAGRR